MKAVDPDPGRVGDFHFVHRIRTATHETGEVYLGRRKDDTLLYAVKILRKPKPSSRIYVEHRKLLVKEQMALKTIAERGACKFVPRLWCSFEDAQTMYLITVDIEVMLYDFDDTHISYRTCAPG